MAADFSIGESLVGDGNEIAHIDLIIGSKTGPAGAAFTQALSSNTDGFTTLLAVVTPNLPCKPDTVLFNKVTIKGAKQAVQMFGPAQAAVARAVMDSVSEGRHLQDAGQRPRHPRGRVHPLAGRGRQEDLPVQLPGDQGVHRPRAARASRRSTRCSPSTRPRGIRSPAAPRADRTVPLHRSVHEGRPAVGRAPRIFPRVVRAPRGRSVRQCASSCSSSTAPGCPACSTRSSRTTRAPTPS